MYCLNLSSKTRLWPGRTFVEPEVVHNVFTYVLRPVPTYIVSVYRYGYLVQCGVTLNDKLRNCE